MTVRDTLNPVQLAALTAAARHKLLLPMEALDDIAAAVLAAHDDVYEVCQVVTPEMWATPEARRKIEWRMRAEFAQNMAELELLPVALPVLNVHLPVLNVNPVVDRVPACSEMWMMVTLTLSAPVRKPA